LRRLPISRPAARRNSMSTKKRLGLFGAAAAATAVTAPLVRNRSVNKGEAPAPRSGRMKITSHETFDHDSIVSLGYDWSRIANPETQPKLPLKVYLPQSTEDLVKIVKEARQLGETL